MPFDSQGIFSRIHNWEDDRQNNIEIVTDHHDEEDDNFASGLSQCLLRDGRAAMEANFNAGNFQIKNLKAGSISSDAVNLTQLNDQIASLKKTLLASINQGFKIGDIKASVKNANHDNWFLCNGQAISRVTYADLFALIGTKFGTGDGTSTFNLPDYRGKFLRGLGGDSASDIYKTQAEGLPNIAGRIWTARNSTINTSFANGAFYMDTQNANGNGTGGDMPTAYTVYMDASRSSKIYGASSHVTPINQAVNYFIKAKEEA